MVFQKSQEENTLQHSDRYLDNGIDKFEIGGTSWVVNILTQCEITVTGYIKDSTKHYVWLGTVLNLVNLSGGKTIILQ